MASQPEKINAKKWIDKITKKYNLWYVRLTDTPYISNKGVVNYKKPFDGILCTGSGCDLAIEWKYYKGINFPFRRWMEDEVTRHQFRNLLKFNNTASGMGVLIIIFKIAGKRDLQKRYLCVDGINTLYKQGKTHLHWKKDMYSVKFLEENI